MTNTQNGTDNASTDTANTVTDRTPKVWLITGAGRGIGASIAGAALAAGEKVVATGRDPHRVEEALGGPHENLLTLQLDVTDEAQAQSVVAEAVRHFGGIDVLVNNAGYGLLGTTEECSAGEVEAQFRTNVFGLLAVTRSVLPTMRAKRRGHILNLSSIGGFVGGDHGSIYCATKFAIEGISESLAQEVAPLGIHVTIIEPGYFRTDFLDDSSIRWAARQIADYDNGTRQQFANHSGQQAGDPDKLAEAVLLIAANPNPPLRLPMGSDAVAGIEGKLRSVAHEVELWRELSCSTDIEQ